MKVYRDKSACLVVRNHSYVMEWVFSGVMSPQSFRALRAQAVAHGGDDPVLVDACALVPLGEPHEFIEGLSERDCALLVSEANVEHANAYAMAAARRGVVKAVFVDRERALGWVVRRRLSLMQYRAARVTADCG